MKQAHIKIFLCSFAFFTLFNLQGQTTKGVLIKDRLVSSTIKPSEKHLYKVDLDKDKFAFFRLMQKGVDIRIITFDPKGNRLEEFDSPNGKNGFELFSIITQQKGEYIIEVSPIDDNEPVGTYELAIDNIKPKAILPTDQVDQVFAPWDNNTTPGAAVAIIKDEKIVYKKGYGLANLEYDVPVTPATIFHIASVSKQFTVFSILLLEKQGKLSLDDDIRKYIPEVPDFGKTITLRHLATHTSGLRDQWNLLTMAGWRMDDIITKVHVLKLVSKQKELNFNPGDEFVYCNTGFTLLAEVVARLSSMSFAQFTKINIFEPLKMNNTLFYDDHEKIVKNRAYSYHTDSTGFKKSVLNYANVGATSLFTTVEDLSLWAINFSNIKVGDSTIIAKMNTQAMLNNGNVFGGALGQFVGHYKGLKEIQHGGADAGYRSFLTRFPDDNLSVIVFSNSAEFNSGGIAHKVADIYLNDKIKVETKTESGDSIVVDRNILATYLGDFELEPGFIISISEKDGKLTAHTTGQPPFDLKALTTTEFVIKQAETRFEFIPNEGKNIELFKLHEGGQIMEVKRVVETKDAPVNLNDFIGDFYSEELSTTYYFRLVDGKLMASHSRLSDFNLSHLKQDLFNGEAWFFGQTQFIRDSSGHVTGCKVSNGRVRNLYFEKIK